jgi:Putative zinc-finger
MNCRKSFKLIGSYLDGELAPDDSSRMEEHLESCPRCMRQLEFLRGITLQLSLLPSIEPTAEERHQLINRVRREMTAPSAPKPMYGRVRVVATALSLLVAATVGLTWMVLGGGGTPTNIEVSQSEGESSNGMTGLTRGENLQTGAIGTITTPVSDVTQPSLVVSGKDYTPTELANFRNDLGTRLDFYSSYWYPASTSGAGAASLGEVQSKLTDDLAEKAAETGKNPDEVKSAVKTALAQAGNATLLPCYAEQAKVGGKDAWLVSLSGPEDYLLFPNQQIPSAMNIASRGGAVSLKISESLLRQLAAMLTPYSPGSTSAADKGQASTYGQDSGGQPQVTVDQSVAGQSTLGTSLATVTPEQQQDFQSFLRDLAAQGTSYDLIQALQGMNYQQLLMLVQGNWSALAADGIDLTDFLIPPQRLWAIDTATNTVIWKP